MSNPFSKHNNQDSQSTDLPPESFWVPENEELDWFNKNAYLDRKGSMKLTFFGSTNSNPNIGSYELIPKTKSSILALAETRTSFFGDRQRLRPENGRLFRSRSESEIKPVGSEPGSPRVSCMGNVVRAKKSCKAKRTGLWVRVRALLMNRFRANRVVSSKGSPVSSETGFGPMNLGASKRLEFYKNI